jgi:hypothetical protein
MRTLAQKKSMIDSMKHLKTKIDETAPAGSGSLAFETLFQEHWTSVYRVLQHLVGGGGPGSRSFPAPVPQLPWLQPSGSLKTGICN